jgi:hypothetical protein
VQAAIRANGDDCLKSNLNRKLISVAAVARETAGYLLDASNARWLHGIS